MFFEEAPLTGGFTGKNLPTQKFAAGETSRIYIFPEFSTRKIKAHFIRGMGVFLCLSNKEKTAPCCEYLNDPSSSAKDKYLMVYMKYATKKDGTLRSDPVDPDEVYFWLCPPTKRNAISQELAKGAGPDGSLTGQDLMIKCTEEAAQKIEVATTGNGTSVKDDPQLAEDYAKAYAKAKEIYDSMAEKAVIVYTEAQMTTKLGNLGMIPGVTPQNTYGGGGAGLQTQTFQPQTFQPQVPAPQAVPQPQAPVPQAVPQQVPQAVPVATSSTETPEDLEDFLNS